MLLKLENNFIVYLFLKTLKFKGLDYNYQVNLSFLSNVPVNGNIIIDQQKLA